MSLQYLRVSLSTGAFGMAGCMGFGYLLKLIRHVFSVKFVYMYAGFIYLETRINLVGPSKQAFSAEVSGIFSPLFN